MVAFGLGPYKSAAEKANKRRADDVRFGSLADLLGKFSLMSALERIAVVQERLFRIKIVGFSGRALNVRFRPEAAVRERQVWVRTCPWLL